jgi:dipeptidyl aminopeptidase/acylaminoacyl peptidase
MTMVLDQVGGGFALDFTFEQVRSYPLPVELVTAPTGARAAWVFIQYGIHNIWAAEGPDWSPFRLTDYREDDGQELTNLRFTQDGQRIVYVRGGDHHANFPAPGNLQPNPNSGPTEPKLGIWVLPFSGGTPQLLAEGDLPEVSPTGDRVAFLRDHQVWAVPLDGSAPAHRLFFTRGKCAELQWSPDGQTLAFVSDRDDHSFIGLYRSADEPIRYLAPSTYKDYCPRWSPDSKQIAFLRTPGDGSRPRLPFELRPDHWSLWVADVETGLGRCLFRNPAALPGWYPRMLWGPFLQWGAGDRLVFRADHEGWSHLYSLHSVIDSVDSVVAPDTPLLLTPGDQMVEEVVLSPDRKFALYTVNAGDTPHDYDRRHLWRTPIDAATPKQMVSGPSLEYSPAVTGDGSALLYLAADAQRPPLPAVIPAAGGNSRRLAEDQIPADFPSDRLVTPVSVTVTAVDGIAVPCQRFERQDGPSAGAAGRKPALIFVHGGPVRQMLLGWHNMGYYTDAYATCQYFAQLGYVVLAVNYRLSIGYGHAFGHPKQAGAAGAAEYRDIVAAGEYLRGDSAVDPARIGIWGGSYGGYLTALALARNSNLFAAGVDFCGVHDWTIYCKDLVAGLQTRVERPDIERVLRVAWESSPVSALFSWRSPVLLIDGDDDRNVEFHQTQDLAMRLYEAGVPTEELIFPDETHVLRCYRNSMQASQALIRFFNRVFLSPHAAALEI